VYIPQIPNLIKTHRLVSESGKWTDGHAHLPIIRISVTHDCRSPLRNSACYGDFGKLDLARTAHTGRVLYQFIVCATLRRKTDRPAENVSHVPAAEDSRRSVVACRNCGVPTGARSSRKCEGWPDVVSEAAQNGWHD
jgi:hypothetical protein